MIEAIRTGGWAVPKRTRALQAKTNRPRKFYFVFDQAGERLGYIAHSDFRPELEFGGPTYFLKRCPSSPLAASGN